MCSNEGVCQEVVPQAPDQLKEAVISCLPTDRQSSCWNGHKRRRAKRGAFVHLFAGESCESFARSAQDLNLEHIPVDIKEDLCSSETYGFSLTLALGAALRVIIGGPPCRTYTVCRHIPAGPNASRPVRSREGAGRHGLEGVSPTESGLVKTDDALFTRFLLLGALTFEAGELLDLPKPAFGIEQRDDLELYLWPAPTDVSANPIYVNRLVNGYPSFWATREWQEFQARYGLDLFRFDQGPSGHARRKPYRAGY